MKTLDEIKQMMSAGDTAQADEALKELLAQEPDNLQAKMLYGTCRQLLGDEETFKRIHDELAPVMGCLKGDSIGIIEIKMWEKYSTLYSDMHENVLSRLVTEDDGAVGMEYVVLAILIILALVMGVVYFGATVVEQMNAQSLYMGARYTEAAQVQEAVVVRGLATSNFVDTVGINGVTSNALTNTLK